MNVLVFAVPDERDNTGRLQNSDELIQSCFEVQTPMESLNRTLCDIHNPRCNEDR